MWFTETGRIQSFVLDSMLFELLQWCSQKQWQCFVTIVMKLFSVIAFCNNVNFLQFGSIIHKDPRTLLTTSFAVFKKKSNKP